MELEYISVHASANNSPARVSATVDDWGDTTLRNHIRQQAIQAANQEIDVAHDVTAVHACDGGWDFDAVLLSDGLDDDAMAGALFVADSWDYEDGEGSVRYYCDSETQQQQEIRERVEDEVAPIIASDTPFSCDMLDIRGVRVRDDLPDQVTLQL